MLLRTQSSESSTTFSNTSERAPFLSTTKRPRYDHSQIRDAVESYKDAVFAVLGFVNVVRFDAATNSMDLGVRFGLGRRMDTSPANRRSPEREVTPDCVIQASPTLGIVAEVKLGLPQDESHWKDPVEQLERYDDDLTGWWTPRQAIELHDIVALMPSARAVRFGDFVDAGVKNNQWRFQRKLSIVGFHKEVGAKLWLTLELKFGSLSDPQLYQEIREGKRIDVEQYLKKDRKFLDQPPPMPLLLQILWDDVFLANAAGKPKEADGSVTLRVDPRGVTEEAQKYYGFTTSGHRSTEIPRLIWIREALDLLVDFNMAAKDADTYVIRYHRPRKDVLQYFGRLISIRERKRARIKGSANQGKLAFDQTTA